MKNTTYIYDIIADKYYETFRGENEFLPKFSVMLPKKAKILDIGCGVGEDTKFLIKKNFDVVSVDGSKKMLAIARRNVPNHKFHLADMRSKKYRPKSFDGIVAAFSLIHLTKKESKSLINNFSIWLKENGMLYLALQEGSGEKNVMEPFEPNERVFINFYEEDEINGVLLSSGFSIIFFRKTNPTTKGEFDNKKIFLIARKVKKRGKKTK